MRAFFVGLVMLAATGTVARADFDAVLSAARTQSTWQLLALLAAGDDPNPPNWHHGYSPLQFAAGNGDLAGVAALLAAGAGTEYRDHNGDRALLWAAKGGHATTAKQLLDAGSPPDSASDPYGRTPLMAAAFSGNAAMVELLLAAGADPHRLDQSGMTALHYAAWGGSPDAAERLLAAGANPNTITNTLFETPLHYGVRFGDARLVALLLDAGTAREARDADGRTPLVLATLSRNEAGVAALLDAGVEPDASDDRGVTALMIAARDGLVEVTRRLLQAGADSLRRDAAGRSAADYLDDLPWLGAVANDHSRAASIVPGPSDLEMAGLREAHAAIRALLAGE